MRTDERLKSLYAKVQSDISDEEILKKYSNTSSQHFTGLIKNSGALSDIRRAKKFAKASASFGYRYAKNTSAVWNLRPNEGMDYFVTYKDGLLKNNEQHSDYQARIEAEKSNGGTILGLFGGSTSMSMGARTPEFSIPSLIEQIFQSKYAKEVVCVNFSIGGTSVEDAFNLLQLKALRHFDLDHVIFYNGWNCSSYLTLKHQVLSQKGKLTDFSVTTLHSLKNRTHSNRSEFGFEFCAKRID